MKKLLIAALMLVSALTAFAVPAQAELTAEEKVDVKLLIDSMAVLREGKDWMIANISSYTTPETRPALYSILYYYERAVGEHQVALASFLHLGHVGAGSVGIDGPNVHKPNVSPETWNAEALRRLDLYAQFIDSFKGAAQAAKAHLTGTANYQFNLDVTISRAISAKNKVLAMNRALPYTDPFPALLPGKTIQTIVGPHGDYRHFGWFIMRKKEYTGNSNAFILPLYRDGASGVQIAHLWARETPLRNTTDQVLGLLADVTFTTEQAGEDRVCRVLRMRKMLGVGLSTAFNNWQGSAASFVPQPWNNFFNTSGDAWRHFDHGLWASDVFPESTRCTSPFLQR